LHHVGSPSNPNNRHSTTRGVEQEIAKKSRSQQRTLENPTDRRSTISPSHPITPSLHHSITPSPHHSIPALTAPTHSPCSSSHSQQPPTHRHTPRSSSAPEESLL